MLKSIVIALLMVHVSLQCHNVTIAVHSGIIECCPDKIRLIENGIVVDEMAAWPRFCGYTVTTPESVQMAFSYSKGPSFSIILLALIMMMIM